MKVKCGKCGDIEPAFLSCVNAHSVPTLGPETERYPAGQWESAAVGVQGYGKAQAHIPLAEERSTPPAAGTWGAQNFRLAL